MTCYRCESPEMERVRMTRDETRFGMDLWRCEVCGCYQNRSGE